MWFGIQYLRGFAALSVAVLHARVIGSGMDPGFAFAAGVDVFFVISGFVMVVSTEDRTFSISRFATARFLRVVPFYWAIAALHLIGLCFVLDAIGTPPQIKVIRDLLLIPAEDIRGLPSTFVRSGWTLVYEAAFYVLFGLSLWLGNWRHAVLGIIVLVSADPIIGGVYTDPIILEFAAGILLAKYRSYARVWMLPLGLALLTMASPERSDLRVIVWGIPGTLLVAGVVALEPHLIKSRALTFFGDASYAIYLGHGVAIIALLHFGFSSLPVMIVVPVAFGIFLHQAVERPLLRALRPRHVVIAP